MAGEHHYVKSHRHPVLEAGYKLLMRRNSVYVAFILGGAMVGERAVDYAMNSLWKGNNKGKLFDDLVAAGTIGGATGGDEE